MSEDAVIVEQNVAIFHIYRYLYDINLLRKCTRIKASEEWTAMAADRDPTEEGSLLEARRQDYVQQPKSSAKKLSKKWKKQFKQMRVKAFHEKIVLISKQLPRTLPPLPPPPTKRPRVEVSCNNNVIITMEQRKVSQEVPVPSYMPAPVLPMVPPPAAVAAAPQDMRMKEADKNPRSR
jgi:hypothetical protein